MSTPVPAGAPTPPPALPTAEQRAGGFPLWLRDIDASLPATGQYVIHGALRDLHLVPMGGAHRLAATRDALFATLAQSGFQALLVHDHRGLSVLPNTAEAVSAATTALGEHATLLDSECGYAQLARVLAAVTASAAPVALLIDYVSQAQPVGDPPAEDLHALMRASLASVHSAARHRHPHHRAAPIRHPVFWLVDRPTHLPGWLLTGDGIRQVPIPVPELSVRLATARLLAPALPGFAALVANDDAESSSTSSQDAVITRFAESTDGMSLRGMLEIVQLANDSGTPAERIEDSVRAYRVGLTDNPWQDSALRERIGGGEAYLSHEILGQPRAVRKTLDILVRSATGLTAAHQRHAGTGPRGVLFFAGPTGVGKTELAKAVTRLVFGVDRAYIRFDMSEFASEHAEARLLGAPPGYVGFGAGGELTNAVRQRPFSVLLFDEIEKAGPRILDKFLQILSDGRLTDGSGDTVYFSESLIVFTSNLGAAEAAAASEHGLPADEFEDVVRTAVERHFTETLGRPELLGRIGDNVVVFQPMAREIAESLAVRYVAAVSARVAAQLGVQLVVPADTQRKIVDVACADLSKGGRGIGMNLEAGYVNPLARALFRVPRGGTVTVAGIGSDAAGSPTVTLR